MIFASVGYSFSMGIAVIRPAPRCLIIGKPGPDHLEETAEVDRSRLVAGCVGQTAIRTHEAIAGARRSNRYAAEKNSGS